MTQHYINDLQAKRFVIFGWKSEWPAYLLPGGLLPHLESRGAIIQPAVTKDTDYVIFDRGRQKGKAKAMRQYEKLKGKGQPIESLRVQQLFHLLRPDIAGLRFAFTGGFSHGAADLDGGPAALLERYGAIASTALTAELDYLIVGERRAKGKTADLRTIAQLNQQGANIQLMHEQPYLDMLSVMNKPGDDLDFPGFVVQLRGVTDPKKIDRAIKMLKKESFQIYADVELNSVAGIVKSQSRSDKYYAAWIQDDGSYCCYDHKLALCMGLQGSMCKHILVLLLGLSNNGDLNPETALTWATECSPNAPNEIEDPSAQMLLRYKGAEAGEIDWRPTETVPEDYYLL